MNEKTKVISAEIIVAGTKDKPYFEIKYKEVGKDYYNIGFGSYYLENVFEWIEKYLEIVNEGENVHTENGWIPCSERLPEEAYGCLVTVIDCEPVTQTDFENILPYFVGYDGERWNDADGEEVPFEVIAWKKLPEPYKEK